MQNGISGPIYICFTAGSIRVETCHTGARLVFALRCAVWRLDPRPPLLPLIFSPQQAGSRSSGSGFLRRLRADYPSVWSSLMAVHAMMQAANKAAAAAALWSLYEARSFTANMQYDPALACHGSNTLPSSGCHPPPFFSRPAPITSVFPV